MRIDSSIFYKKLYKIRMIVVFWNFIIIIIIIIVIITLIIRSKSKNSNRI